MVAYISDVMGALLNVEAQSYGKGKGKAVSKKRLGSKFILLSAMSDY
jgi:hypothetical protein